jgi:hypothetical protein
MTFKTYFIKSIMMVNRRSLVPNFIKSESPKILMIPQYTFTFRTHTRINKHVLTQMILHHFKRKKCRKEKWCSIPKHYKLLNKYSVVRTFDSLAFLFHVSY